MEHPFQRFSSENPQSIAGVSAVASGAAPVMAADSALANVIRASKFAFEYAIHVASAKPRMADKSV
jgi:hypothetical protein